MSNFLSFLCNSFRFEHKFIFRTLHKYLALTLAFFISGLAFYSPVTLAQQAFPEPIIDWQARLDVQDRLTSLGNDLMGDSIDHKTGAVVFNHTDVVLPGNNNLEVAVRRRLSRGFLYDISTPSEFGDWEIVVPRITAITAEETNFRTGARCSGLNQFQRINVEHNNVTPSSPFFNQFLSPYLQGYEYSQGVEIQTPKYGDEAVLFANQGIQNYPNATKFMTKSHMSISCLDNIDGGGEGFLAKAPDGTEYKFNKFYELHSEDQLLSNFTAGFVKRYRSIIAATEVTDVNGNWVKYDYDIHNRLTKIHSNDGREITLHYNSLNAPISSVRVNGREWTYNYDSGRHVHQYAEWGQGQSIVGQSFHSLAKVSLPDGRSWSFNATEMSRGQDIDGCTPQFKPPINSQIFSRNIVTMTHPSGANGRFYFDDIRQRVGEKELETRTTYGAAQASINLPGLEFSLDGSWNVSRNDRSSVDIACPFYTQINQTRLPDAPDSQLAHLASAAGNHIASLARLLVDAYIDGDVGAVLLIDSSLKAAVAEAEFIQALIFNASLATPSPVDGDGDGPVQQIRINDRSPANILMYRKMTALKQKILTGSDIPDGVWNFDYSEVPLTHYSNKDSISSVPESNRVNRTTMTEPDGSETVFEYHWDDQQFGGELKRLEKRDSTSKLIQIVDFQQTAEPILLRRRFSGLLVPPVSLLTHVHTTKQTVTQDRDSYTTETEYNLDVANSDYSYGYPTSISSYSNVNSAPRTIVTEYEHNKSKWILGLPKKITQNGREMKRYDYNALGQTESVARYGQADFMTFDYNSDGTIKSYIDAIGRKTEAHDWKRGGPQRIIRAAGTADETNSYQYVDDNGWLTSSKDALGRTTTYDHDIMGRLTQINPTGAWAKTEIDYDFPSAGGAVQTTTKGPSESTVTYDSMFRPVLAKTEALDTGWTSYVNMEYDGLGRTIFTSQPSSSATESKGTNTTYDGLGRVYDVTENVAPFAKTRHRHYNNHRYRVIDPSGAYTEYRYRGYDGPDNADYRYIRNVDSSRSFLRTTVLFKNIHSQMYRLRQYGSMNGISVDKNQHFYYDNRQRLCRYYVPEHGASLYQYDDAGQMTAYAKGQGNSGCGTVPTSADKVSMTYDNLGRLTLTDFTDSATPDITRDYDAVGNLLSVNRGTGTDTVDWAYTYHDDYDVLLSETLNIDGRDFKTSYRYNNNGHLEYKKTPSGRWMDINTDGLGRDISVSGWAVNDYVSNIQYHPNGTVASMQYRNGDIYTQELNDRLLPSRRKSYNSADGIMDKSYSYDARGLITSITDSLNNSRNESYSYDGLGQMVTSQGTWGAGTYSYDSLGNIRTKTEGSRTVDLSYDTRNRLNQSEDTGATGTRTVAYDHRGNVTTLGSMGFVYDKSDQPTIVSGTADGVGAANGNYQYDGNLKRVKSVVNGRTVYNIYDASGALTYIQKLAGGGEPEKEIDYIKAAGMTVLNIDYGVRATYMHTDHLGSPLAGTSTAGNLLWSEQYSPFGEQLLNPAANDDLMGYTGHIKDKATGLNYMQARYYDPVMGRFLSIDPVDFIGSGGNPGFFNRYAYTMNDPINLIDPFGEACTSADGTTECVPGEDKGEGVPSAKVPTPDGFKDYDATHSRYHEYRKDDDAGSAPDGVSDEDYKSRLQEGLAGDPTGNNVAASDEGTTINVDIPGPFGRDDVKSYTKTDSDGNPFIINITTKNHSTRWGVVIRQVQPNGSGGFKIVTYGEGQSHIQILPGTAGAAKSRFSQSSQGIIERARKP